ncbi:unnamed protein product [Protopolystoma xenopodis]|uniref:Uncharacterized protein n=1 Tax=Protopolystoma xenopodis TaxID=117903 RepID=A0A3S5A1C8_9PLAT|nr:unnamed protein product [Protopolystoma xenopodis]
MSVSPAQPLTSPSCSATRCIWSLGSIDPFERCASFESRAIWVQLIDFLNSIDAFSRQSQILMAIALKRVLNALLEMT